MVLTGGDCQHLIDKGKPPFRVRAGGNLELEI